MKPTGILRKKTKKETPFWELKRLLWCESPRVMIPTAVVVSAAMRHEYKNG